MRKSPASRTRAPKLLPAPSMDTEQINAVGSLLADLSERTEQLRGYL
jgi:hypothetical protein